MAVRFAPNETVARYDRDPNFIVVLKSDQFLCRHQGGIPTPALIEACSDGRAHEAWRTLDGIWRLRDDRFDATRDDFPGTYERVLVGRPASRED